MLDSEQEKKLVSLLTEVVVAFFGSNKAPVTHTSTSTMPDSSADETDLAGVIGFSGTTVRGTMIVLIDPEIVAMTWPAEIDECESDLRDWLGEICNLLLGRMKHRFAQYGVIIDMASPTTFTGRELNFRELQEDKFARWYTFATPEDQTLSVRLSLTYQPNFRMLETEHEGDFASESEMLLF